MDFNQILRRVLPLVTCLSTYFLTSCDKKVDPDIYSVLLNGMPYGSLIILESNTGKLDTGIYGNINQLERHLYTDKTSFFWQSGSVDSYEEHQEVIFNNKLGFEKLTINRSTYFIEQGTPPDESVIKLSLQIDSDTGSNYYKGKKQRVTFNDIVYKDCIEMRINDFAKVLYSKNYGVLRINYLKGSDDSVFVVKQVIPAPK